MALSYPSITLTDLGHFATFSSSGLSEGDILVMEAAMFRPQLILHPTDYSESSSYALQIAADLARQLQAKILILHVAETLGPENVTFGEATSQLEPASYRHRLEADLR